MRNFLLAGLACFGWAFAVHAQTLEGVVTDASGSPLPSATIQVDGGKQGSFTDVSGRYSIPLSAGQHTVEFSFIDGKRHDLARCDDDVAARVVTWISALSGSRR